MFGLEYNATYVNGFIMGLLVAAITLTTLEPRETVKEYFKNTRSIVQGSSLLILFLAWLFTPITELYSFEVEVVLALLLFGLFVIVVNSVLLNKQEQRKEGYEDAIEKLKQNEDGQGCAELLEQFEYDDEQTLTKTND